MGLADSMIPVSISNTARKSLHSTFSAPSVTGGLVEEDQKTCYNSGYGITLYDEVHVHE